LKILSFGSHRYAHADVAAEMFDVTCACLSENIVLLRLLII
jgi:hypothetical protein